MDQNKKVLKFYVDANSTGNRLDKFLGLIEEIGSRSRAAQLIENELVTVNNKKPKASLSLNVGDSIEVQLPQKTETNLQPLDLKLDILFEDSDLLVINKPAGLVVHPAAGHEQDTLVNALIAHTEDLSMKFGENRPGIVHRIDKETSGLLVVAKNDFTHEGLAKQFKDRTIQRKYQAIVFGIPNKKTGRIESFLARHPADRKKYASVLDNYKKKITDPNADISFGKWAVTDYEVLQTNNSGLSLVQLKLHTGRTHQIRIHLSEMGHPIIADDLYGAGKKLNSIKAKELRAQLEKVPRFALHAFELGFVHPRTGTNLFYKVGWPSDMHEILEILGFSNAIQ